MSEEKTLGYIVANFKRKLRTTLSSNDDIVTILNPEESPYFDIDQVLLGGTYEVTVGGKKQRENLQGYILDFYYIPDTVIEHKMFICVEVNVDTIEKNIISDFIIDVCVFTPKTNIILTEYTTPKKSEMINATYLGNRIDCCVDAIERIFKGSVNYGLGVIKPLPRGYMSISAPNNDYYGKRLKFTCKGYSPKEDDSCGN